MPRRIESTWPSWRTLSRPRDCAPQPVWQLDELEELCRQPGFAAEYRCVVAAGGDGTLNRTINYRLSVPLAVLPLGNENLFARQFGFTTDPVLLAGKIARGKTRSIDLGRAGQQLFSVVVSGGFDGDVAHRLADWRQDQSRLRRVGSHSYVLPIATSICCYRFPIVELEADGQRFAGALAMIFNVPRYALGLRLCPDALPDDGWLDWVVFARPGRVRLAVYAAAVALGQHRRLSDVRYGRAHRLWLRSAASVPLELDGEAAEFTPIEMSIEPLALRIVTGWSCATWAGFDGCNDLSSVADCKLAKANPAVCYASESAGGGRTASPLLATADAARDAGCLRQIRGRSVLSPVRRERHRNPHSTYEGDYHDRPATADRIGADYRVEHLGGSTEPGTRQTAGATTPSELNIRYAEVYLELAKVQLQRALDTDQQVPGTFTNVAVEAMHRSSSWPRSNWTCSSRATAGPSIRSS